MAVSAKRREYMRAYDARRPKKTERRFGLSALARFERMAMPVTESGCWLWTGAISRGYGLLSAGHGKTPHKAHRLAWQLFKGEIPTGMFVCHKCDTPSCCNPDHLFLGSHADNVRDAAIKGRLVRKLSDAQVAEIRSASGRIKQRDLAIRFGVSQIAISKIQRGQNHKHTLPLPRFRPVGRFVIHHED